tara:strand:- start:262 stop:1224 length:963 start_codon:yes stop_codon:yes gene_type:complete
LFKHVIAAGFLLSLASCASDHGLTDAGGRSLSLSPSGGIQPSESRFNTFLFLEPSVAYLTESFERDNGRGYIEEVYTKGRGTFFSIEFVNTAWFSFSTEDRMLDQSQFRKLANNFYIPESSYVKIDQISPRIKGWIATTGKCSVGEFAKRLKIGTSYDNDRGYADAVIRFGSCSRIIAPPKEIAQRIGLITEAEKQQLRITYQSIGTLKAPAPKGSETVRSEPEVFDAQWEGISNSLTGSVTRKGAAQYNFDFDVAEQKTSCTGTAVTAKSSRLTGTWQFSCENGLTAKGIWNGKTDQPITGEGYDQNKRKITFKLADTA